MMINILFLRMGSDNASEVDQEKEVKNIDNKLKSTGNRDRFNLIFEKYRKSVVTLNRLREILLEDKPDIVHFYGNGINKTDTTSPSQNSGGEKETDALPSIFDIPDSKIHCIILSSNSEEQAAALIDAVDCVISIPNTINSDAKSNFVANFYREIALGMNMKKALDISQNELLSGVSQDKLPRLKLRQGIDPEKLIIFFNEWPVTITVKNVSKRDDTKSEWFIWAVWIETRPESFLEQISKVEYHLHHTFPKKDVLIDKREGGFPLASKGWGEFVIKLDIILDDGRTAKLSHYLALRDENDETPQETSKVLKDRDFTHKKIGILK